MSLQPATFPAGAWDGTTDYRGANDDKSPNYALTDRLIAELVAVQDYLIGTGLLPSIELGGANQLLGMDSGGTTLEYKPITIDASGNIAGIANIVATGTINSGAITSSAGIIGTSLRSPSLFAVAATGANVVGTDITITPGASNGNATGSKVIIKSSTVGSSGATPQTQHDGFTFGPDAIVQGFNPNAVQGWKLSGSQTVGSGTATGRLDLGNNQLSLLSSAGGSLTIYSSSTVQALFISGIVKAPVSGGFAWASANYTSSNGIALPITDTQLSRSAAGLVEINNGTLGQYRDLQIRNLVSDTTTGTKIGTAATQKIGFFGGTPIVRPVLATGSTADQIITALQGLGLVSQT